ncbi:MAG: CHAT domain-containing protein [Acidimicrobiales bacterium]
MLGPAQAGFDAPMQWSVPAAVCRLGFRNDGRLTVQLAGAAPTGRFTLRRVHRSALADLVAWHSAAVVDGVEGSSGGGAVTATEQFLHLVYEQVSVHLTDLVAGLPRVMLQLDDEVLAQLPLETAHRPDRPALFELTQCYRSWPGGGGGGGGAMPRRRRFRLEHRRGDERGLPAVALERALVGNTTAPGSGASLIHVAGHEPAATRAAARQSDGQDHLVLSGCNSLPATLPPGVASVVGTLWPVEDHACVTVMAAYHRRLAVGVGPLEALRQTLLLHRPLPPDTWAAWAYLGQPN